MRNWSPDLAWKQKRFVARGRSPNLLRRSSIVILLFWRRVAEVADVVVGAILINVIDAVLTTFAREVEGGGDEYVHIARFALDLNSAISKLVRLREVHVAGFEPPPPERAHRHAANDVHGRLECPVLKIDGRLRGGWRGGAAGALAAGAGGGANGAGGAGGGGGAEEKEEEEREGSTGRSARASLAGGARARANASNNVD